MKREAVGILPKPGWLISYGYGGLYQMLRKYPEAFKHVRQHPQRLRRTAEEWVPVAEEIASQHGGCLPCWAVLTKMGHTGLCLARQRNPKLFAHIPCDSRGGRSADEWVDVAEHIAQENGGAIPYDAQLDKMGLAGLAAAMKKHPERFAHLKQVGVLDKWIPIAKKLAEEHGGALPALKWLEKNGYNGLRMALRRRPELFAHIQRAPDSQQPDNSNWFLFWVPFAKKLTQEHKGRLPSDKWLTRHNYQVQVSHFLRV